jgi:hypothetical protein
MIKKKDADVTNSFKVSQLNKHQEEYQNKAQDIDKHNHNLLRCL